MRFITRDITQATNGSLEPSSIHGAGLCSRIQPSEKEKTNNPDDLCENRNFNKTNVVVVTR